jgi:hypothetical protein
MATIILDYNSRNRMAQQVISFIRSLGIFTERSAKEIDDFATPELLAELDEIRAAHKRGEFK